MTTQPHWTENARCLGADPELFFPEPGSHKAEAQYVLDVYCNRCVVRDICLQQADLEEPTHADINGIRGGLTRTQRRERLVARHALENADKPDTPTGCGTYKGYKLHRRNQEIACEPCRAAAKVYQREYRARREDVSA